MEPNGENGVLFTAEYCVLQHTVNNFHLEPEDAITAIEEALRYTDGQRLSHDNMTGIVCLSTIQGLSYHRKYFHRDWWWRIHPRDIIFYLNAMGGVGWVLGFPFLPLLWLIQLITCASTALASTGELDTDGKILVLIRNLAMGWTINHKLCTWILWYRNRKTWGDIFAIYFKDPKHPNTRLARRIK